MIKNTDKNNNIIKYYYNLIFYLLKYILKCNLFLWLQANFSAAIILVKCHMLKKYLLFLRPVAIIK